MLPFASNFAGATLIGLRNGHATKKSINDCSSLDTRILVKCGFSASLDSTSWQKFFHGTVTDSSFLSVPLKWTPRVDLPTSSFLQIELTSSTICGAGR